MSSGSSGWGIQSTFDQIGKAAEQWKSVWGWLVSSSRATQQTPDHTRQSNLLASMLLVACVSGVFYLVYSLVSGEYGQGIYPYIYAATILTFGVAYFLNRQGYFVAAAWISAGVQAAVCFFLTFFTYGDPIDLHFLDFLILPVLFSSLFLPPRATWWVGLLLSGAAFGTATLGYGFTPVSVFEDTTFFLLLVSGIVYLMSRQRDVLEAVRKQDLMNSERLYRSLFENANDAIFLLSPENIHISANQKAADMLGYAKDEIIGMRVEKVIAPHEYGDAMRIRRALLAGETPPLYERIFVKKDGTQFPVEINATLISGEDGKPLYVQSVIRDITERKQMEQVNAQLLEEVLRANDELGLAYQATLEGWARALELRDKETEGHSQRVVRMTLRLASAMGITGEALTHVRRGALLHDIGKMGIPDHILLKPGPLTPEEWDIMRMHPRYAVEMLAPITYLQPALEIPYSHHEKWDGTGYPRGLKGEAIPLAARIFAVVDVWDALSSDRPYRAAWSNAEVLAYLLEQSGTHFDPAVLEMFLRIMEP